MLSKKSRVNNICRRIMNANAKMIAAKGKVFEHYRGIMVGAALELALESFDHAQWERDKAAREASKPVPAGDVQ